MELRPSGSSAVLVQLDDLDEVLALYAALVEEPLPGVVDVVPAASTVLLVLDPAVTSPARAGEAVRRVRPRPGGRRSGEQVEVPVRYDGEDLDDVAALLGCDRDEVVARHTGATWTVAFCGFAPGFGYLTDEDGDWDVPRRASPRTRVPAGSVALAGRFSGVYPRESPGGWQLLGTTSVPVFDLARDPAALLRPGVRVRFVAEHP
jgi:KipI family sensor histidine kinase inhibitor